MDLSFLVIGAKYTRPELASRWGYSSHHAISRGVVTPQGEKIIFIFVTRIKQEALTQYEDALSGDLFFWEGQEKHGTDDRVIAAKNAGDEIHLFYREIHHTPFEYKGRILLLSYLRGTDEPSRFVIRLEHDQGAIDDLERFRNEIDEVPEATEREELRPSPRTRRAARMALRRSSPAGDLPGSSTCSAPRTRKAPPISFTIE
jgi:hypothetical protein